MDGPLVNFKVIDLTMYLAGPLASMYLGDMGADVIKVEPLSGDGMRKAGPPFYGEDSAYFMAGNRNKKSICIDLKTDIGREIFLRIARDADVVIENFRPGVMDGLGLGYEVLAAANPKLVYVGLSGFGETGPYRHVPAFDTVIQAYSGWMSITGTEETGPLRPGPSIADLLGGIHSAFAATLALLDRERTGKGQKATVSLLDCMISTLLPHALSFFVDGKIPKRVGNSHPVIVPFGTYPTSDGSMNVAAGTIQQWRNLCFEIGAAEFADDPRLQDNEGRSRHREEINEVLRSKLAYNTTKYWVERFAELSIPCAPVNDLKQVFEDPQVIHNKMLIEMAHSTAGNIKVLNNPFRLRQTPIEEWTPPPTLGQHTVEILFATGFTKEQVDEYIDRKIVVARTKG